MDTSYIIIGPLFGLLGVVIGAILHSLLSRRNDENRSLTELRNAAYADFLNAASQIAVAQRRGHREHVSVQLAALADAKARICVYGHSNVVKALAKFLRHGGTLQTEPEILAFTKLCLEIRTSAGMKRKELYSSDISQLLFSVDVKNVETPK